MQIIVEMGILGIALFAKIALDIIKGVTQKKVRDINIIRFAYLTSFLFISMQSSSGIFSNYFVWTVLIYLAFSKGILEKQPIPDKLENRGGGEHTCNQTKTIE